MRTVTLYLMQNSVIYSVNDAGGQRQGIFTHKEIENFLSENIPGVLNVILPKPEVIFRKLEFPFTNRKNIRLVLFQELENVLPETPENYYYSIEFNPVGKAKTSVTVYAVKNTNYDFWKGLAKKYNSKIFLFSDTHLLHLFLKQNAIEKSHIGIYGIQGYILINLTQEGVFTGSYSYDFKTAEIDRVKELISGVLSHKNLPVYRFVEENIIRDVGIEAEKVQDISFPRIDKPFFFHSLLTLKGYRKPLQLKKPQRKKKTPVYEIILFAFFLVSSVLLFFPYFHIPSKQREINELNRKMEETFLAVFPDVKRIVNPLVQIKEKLLEQKDINTIISDYPSILKVMANITMLVPENISVSIDQFIVAGNSLTISGSTDSLTSLEIIKRNIENSKCFTVNNMGTISFDARDRVNFNITLGINK